MSAPTEENKKPAGIESFLIVAYRSLRGRKSGVSYRERNLIDASAEKIKSMAENLSLDPVMYNSFTSFIADLPQVDPKALFVLFRNDQNRMSQQVCGGGSLTVAQLVDLRVSDSLSIHISGRHGLTIIIHENYVVKLVTKPEVMRITSDTASKELRVVSTVIPHDCVFNYAKGWASCNRSFATKGFNVYYIDTERQVVHFDMRRPEIIVLSTNSNTETTVGYQDLCLNFHRKKSFFAITSDGSLDYYENVKFKQRYILSDEDKKLDSTQLIFTTMTADSHYCVVSGLSNTQNKNLFVCHEIRNKGRKLKRVGAVRDGIPEKLESHNNCVHRMVFMYPKRYRILIAQHLFSLTSVLYVGKRTFALLGTKRITSDTRLLWTMKYIETHEDKYFMGQGSTNLFQVTVQI